VEKVLFDIDAYIKEMTREIQQPYNFGVTIIEAEYIDLVVDTESIVNTNTNVRIAFVDNVFITLKGE